MRLSDIGESVSYREAIDWVDELRREWGTHLGAAEDGWSFVAGYGELMAMLQAQTLRTVYRAKDAEPEVLPTPWGGTAVKATAEEQQRADRALERYSGIPG